MTWVSIHARAWRATELAAKREELEGFNSRPRVAGDSQMLDKRCTVDVSIHARAWRATLCIRASGLTTPFQFTPARGGRRQGWRAVSKSVRFNSRPRVAGDTGARNGRQPEIVSIHARAWRATPRDLHHAGGLPVSIHARAWRATGDTRRATHPAHVSIHARAWRATLRCARAARARRGFNSRPRVAGDTALKPSFPNAPFQFTPARGGRPGKLRAWCARGRFNSRPRVAGDELCRKRAERARWFQFTPARGGRLRVRLRQKRVLAVSIHARAWRATLVFADYSGSLQVSIHARAWRATHAAGLVDRRRVVSIHARAWRATSRRLACSSSSCVSIHARAWRATSNRHLCSAGLYVSIHARAWRATHARHAVEVGAAVSIHARAWRATPQLVGGPVDPAGFNSRPRVAGDEAARRVVEAEQFQFTPARGGRQIYGCFRF